MADIFDRQGAIAELVSRGLNEDAANAFTDGQLVDDLRIIEANPGLTYKAKDDTIGDAPEDVGHPSTVSVHLNPATFIGDAAKLERTIRDAVIGKAPRSAIDEPESILAQELATITHGHMPDITPAQTRALAVAVIGDAIGAGVPLNGHAQVAILVSATLFPLAWVIADAVIRYGRGKHIFGAK